jgi:hypothetical protein
LGAGESLVAKKKQKKKRQYSTIMVNPKTQAKIKILAAQNDSSIKDFVDELVNYYALKK